MCSQELHERFPVHSILIVNTTPFIVRVPKHHRWFVLLHTQASSMFSSNRQMTEWKLVRCAQISSTFKSSKSLPFIVKIYGFLTLRKNIQSYIEVTFAFEGLSELCQKVQLQNYFMPRVTSILSTSHNLMCAEKYTLNFYSKGSQNRDTCYTYTQKYQVF